MSKIAVKGELLKWAIERAQKDVTSLQKKFPKLNDWLIEKSKPTLRQLEDFAKTTYTPFGFLLLDKPPEESLPFPHFRTIQDEEYTRPSPELIDTIQTMQIRQAWMREYLIEEGQAALPFVNSARVDDNHVMIANNMRRLLGFDDDWAEKRNTWAEALRSFREALENLGVLVIVNGIVGSNNTSRPLNVREFRGFVMVDEYAPLVFVNGKDSKAAQMFTLAHEFAHILFGKSASFDLRDLEPAADEVEKVCNNVAAEFLAPSDKIQKIWHQEGPKKDKFKILGEKFKVSQIVIARRVLDLKFITKKEFQKFYNEFIRFEKTPQATGGGGNPYSNYNLRIGERFAKTVIRAALDGKLLYSDAYRLTDLYGKTFETYALRLGMI